MGDLKRNKEGKRSLRRQTVRYDVSVANRRRALNIYEYGCDGIGGEGSGGGGGGIDGIADEAEMAREESSAPEAE